MLEEMLDDERLRALLAMRSRVKEVTEAWSVCEQVRAATVLAAVRLQPCAAQHYGQRPTRRGPCAIPNP